MKTYKFTKHDLNKLKEFFEPKENHVQVYFTDNKVPEFLMDLGYNPTKESSEDIYYFIIPDKFRMGYFTKSVTEFKKW